MQGFTSLSDDLICTEYLGVLRYQQYMYQLYSIVIIFMKALYIYRERQENLFKRKPGKHKCVCV